MSFVVEAELMKSQQPADLVAAGKDFSAVQTHGGFAVFFTVTSDNKLNAIRETSHDASHKLGWQKVNMTPTGVDSITDFAIAQNPATLNFDIAVASVTSGKHSLWISQNNSADIFSTFKDNAITWQEKPPPKDVAIAKLYIMNMFDGNAKVQMIYADIYRHPEQQQSKLIDRYLINPAQQPHWFPRSMGADFFSDSMRTCVGRPKGETTAGVYTFGVLNTSQQLTYQPSMLGREPGHTGNVSRLIAPPESYSIASAPALDGHSTNLFLAAKSGLYLYEPEYQFDGAVPRQVFAADTNNLTKLLFDGIAKMTARWMGDQVVLFILNTKQQLLYTSCTIGEEKIPSSWKMPVPICSQVQDYTFFVDTEANRTSTDFGNVVFAETTHNKLIMLDQNLSTGIWNTSYILLPAADVKTYHETTSFAAQVRLVDSKNKPQPGAQVKITAAAHMTAYIDGVFYALEPEVAVSVATAVDGIINIVQDVTSLAASSYALTAGEGGSLVTKTVDPTDNAYGKLKEAQTSDGIQKVTVIDASGKSRPLIPTVGASGKADSVSKNIKAILDAKTALAGKYTVPSTSKKRSDGQRSRRDWDLWGWTIPVGDLIQLAKDGINAVEDGVVKAVTDVVDFAVQVVENVYHVVLTIGEQLWSAVLDTVQAIGDAAVTAFNAVKSTIEDLVSWLGFLFEWEDIQRTHAIMVKMMGLYLENMTKKVEDMIKSSNTTISEMAKKMREYLHPKTTTTPSVASAFKDQTKTMDKTTEPAYKDKTANSPQVGWGSRMVKENGSSATVKGTPTTPTTTQNTDLDTKLSGLKPSHDSQQSLAKKIGDFSKDVVDNIMTMSPMDIVTKTCDVIIDILETLGKTLISGVLGLIKSVVDLVLKALTQPIEIPVLSGLYSKFISDGRPMTILDLSCLVLAAPITVLYKVVVSEAPFPKTNTKPYDDAMAAKDWKHFLDALNQPTSGRRRGGFEPGVRFNLQAFFNIAAFVGATIITGMTIIKMVKKISDAQFTGGFLLVGIPAYVAYVLPNSASAMSDQLNWWNLANDFCTVVAVGKAILDFGLNYTFGKVWSQGVWGIAWRDVISPILDTVINIAWTVVLFGGFITSINTKTLIYDSIMFLANLAFDIGGVISVCTSDVIMSIIPPPVGPAVNKIAKVASPTLNVVYGLMCVASVYQLSRTHH